MEQEQKLGIKVFYYYLSKKVLAGVILLIVSFIILSFKGPIVTGLKFAFSTNTSSGIFSFIINTLFIITFLVIAGGVLLSWLKYTSCTFTLGENAFSIKKGLLSKREVSIPYRQIQDMSIEQGFADRMMGVCKLNILTAGNDNNDKEGEAGANFKVIGADIAKNLQNAILEKTNIQKAQV